MKLGSLVECVSMSFPLDDDHIIKGVQAQIGSIYTVRGIDICPWTNDPIIFLEEIISKIEDTTGQEWGYDMQDFRELQPPIDLSEILEYQHPVYLLTSTQS